MSNATENNPKPNFVGSPKIDFQSSEKTKCIEVKIHSEIVVCFFLHINK